MIIIRAKDYEDMSIKAAGFIKSQIKTQPDSVLGLAAGSSVSGIYEILVLYHKKGELDFGKTEAFMLDEYIGLPASNGQSFHYYMNQNLFSKVNINPENIHIPDGLAPDTEEECKRYSTLLEKAGGTDIQLLGLGNNGHIGFNEPADVFVRETHVVDLDESTVIANARFFADESEVPRRAITMGIGNIMHAEQIVLCVSGKQKAEATKAVITGPITPKVPGSVLQLHRNCVVVADEDALSLIKT